jgi:RNA polymerase sigma-70 factor (ECF subfamily)
MDIDLLTAIKSLPPQQRSVVVLFYYEDRPMEEIAGIVGCSTATGWVHLHRARKRLGALLTEEVGNDVH